MVCDEDDHLHRGCAVIFDLLFLIFLLFLCMNSSNNLSGILDVACVGVCIDDENHIHLTLGWTMIFDLWPVITLEFVLRSGARGWRTSWLRFLPFYRLVSSINHFYLISYQRCVDHSVVCMKTVKYSRSLHARLLVRHDLQSCGQRHRRPVHWRCL